MSTAAGNHRGCPARYSPFLQSPRRSERGERTGAGRPSVRRSGSVFTELRFLLVVAIVRFLRLGRLRARVGRDRLLPRRRALPRGRLFASLRGATSPASALLRLARRLLPGAGAAAAPLHLARARAARRAAADGPTAGR